MSHALPVAQPLFRTSRVDGWLVAASVVQALVCLALLALCRSLGWAGQLAVAVLLGSAIWWNANTVAHIHMHRPLFASKGHNRLFALWLSLLTGIPQVVWRHRHMWHHAGEPQPPPKLRWQPQLFAELAVIGLSWLAIASFAWPVLVGVWWPAFGFGMVLCQLQGHYEHARPGAKVAAGISHYSVFYNWFWFNDGFHVEHHLEPTRHWQALPALKAQAQAPESPLPPVVRMFEPAWQLGNVVHGQLMVGLEQFALALPPVAQFMVASHRQAFAQLFRQVGAAPRHIVVVGGGLFPRSVLVLVELLPHAELVVVEQEARHIVLAQEELARRNVSMARIRFVCGRFDPTVHAQGVDLVVLPLGLVGAADILTAGSPCPVAVHTWWWSRVGHSVAVSPWLLKRLAWRAAPEVEPAAP